LTKQISVRPGGNPRLVPGAMPV